MNKFTKKIISFFILTLLVTSGIFGVRETKSAVRDTLNFQGKIQNSVGTNVTDGSYNLEFKIYNGPSSADALLWTETWSSTAVFSGVINGEVADNGTSIVYDGGLYSGTLKVGQVLYNTTDIDRVYITDISGATGATGTIVVSNTSKIWTNDAVITILPYLQDGIFSVELNSLQDNWNNVDFGTGDLWLGVNFNSDGEMKPRKQLTAVPYAKNASNVIGDGYIEIASDNILKDATNINYDPASGDYDALEVTRGSNGAGVAVNVVQSGVGNAVSIDQNGNVGSTLTTDGALFVENTGNTGIGFNVYSNLGATADASLAYLTADNAAFDQEILTVRQDGTGAIASFTNTAAATSDAFTISNLGLGDSFVVNDEGSDTTQFVIDASGKVGIGTTTPLVILDIYDTGAIRVPAGTDAQRPTGGTGMVRYNSTATQFEGFNGTNWSGLGGVIDVDRDTYILAEASSGSDNDSLFFNTAGSEKMILTKDGLLGLGTSTPTANFQVSQPTAGTGTVATDGTITLAGTGTQFLNTFKVGDTITVSGETERTIASISSDTSLTVTLAFSTTAPVLSYTLTGGTRFAVLGNGNIGIGITVPSYPLHVAGQCVTADTKLRRRRRKRKGEKADPDKDEWEDDEFIYDEVMIKDVQPGDQIASMNPITGKLVYSQVNGLMNMGVKPLYRLTTLSGRQIRTTENHPYFVRTKYEEDEIKKQNQKLYRFEVDQSIRFEEFARDTIIALANGEQQTTISIPRKLKLELLKKAEENNDNRKKLAPSVVASVIVLAIQQLQATVHELVIDTEYPSHDDTIASIIKKTFPAIEISFEKIGKKSPAHFAAYGVYKKQKTADYIAGIDNSAHKTENALRTVLYKDKSLTHLSPQALLINNSIDDNKNLVKGEGEPLSRQGGIIPLPLEGGLVKSGRWVKVKGLKVKQMIAVTHGDKIVWERITKIEQLPAERVYDIEVQGTHNFIANGIVAHNTYIDTASAAALRVEKDGVNDDVLVVDTNAGNVGIGTASPAAKLSVNGGLHVGGDSDPGDDNLLVDGAITGTSINSGTGLIQGTGGLTITGAAVSLNNSSNFATNINTGTSTGTISIGNAAAGALTLASSGASSFNVTGNSLTLSTSTSGSLIATSAGLMDLNAGANLDIDITGTFDVLSSGAFSIDGTGASNLSVASGNLTVSTSGSGNLIFTSAGDFDLTAVVFDIDSGTIDLATQTVDVTLNNAVDALNFDSNTLSIDALNNRIGIGTATPVAALEVQGTIENGLVGWWPMDEGTGTTVADRSINAKNGTITVESSVCPTGYVLVPGNATYGTSDFCVMKYEASDVAGVATSQADITPWASITQTAAITECSDTGGHLMTNDEWMAIARDVEAQAANWADGVVGSTVASGGGLFRGNVGILDSASYNGSDPEYGTGRNVKAKLVLSNGEEIWDLSGNVWEWVNQVIACAGAQCTVDEMPYDATPGSEWVEFTAINSYGELDYDKIRPAGNGLNADYGVGQIYTDSNAASLSGNTHAFLRGGDWGDGAGAGVFTLILNNAPSYTHTLFGFRCAR